jgi:predicted nucleic acid-binding protein
MSVECFLDTNVLVYAAAGRGAEDAKRRRALELIETEEVCLSAQVLQEFFVTVVRKVAVPLPVETALEWIEALEAFPCVAIDSSLVKIAAELSVRHRISYWDAAIVAAAEALGAPVIYSEDLSDGQSYGGVRVRNPFRGAV